MREQVTKRGSAIVGRHVSALLKVVDVAPVTDHAMLAGRNALHRAAKVTGSGGILLPLSPAEIRALYELMADSSLNPHQLKIYQRLRKAQERNHTAANGSSN